MSTHQKLPCTTRAIQTSSIFKLPNEVLVLIVENDHLLELEDVRSLAQTSYLFSLICWPHFHKRSKFDYFIGAVDDANLEWVKRCAQFDGISVNLDCMQNETRLISRPVVYGHTIARPICRLLVKFESRRNSADDTYNVLEWLLENGAILDPIDCFFASDEYPELVRKCLEKGTKLKPEDYFYKSDRFPFVESILEFLGYTSWNRDEIDAISRMALLVYNKGGRMPRRLNPEPCHWAFPIGSDKRRRQGIMEILLLMHCPPQVLEIFLAFFHNKRKKKTVKLDIGPVLFRAFELVFDNNYGWKEKFQGEALEWLHKKINILEKYRAIDSIHIQGFKNMSYVLGELYANRKFLNMEKGGLHCWHKLCMSASTIIHSPTPSANFTVVNPASGRLRIRVQHFDPRAYWAYNEWAKDDAVVEYIKTGMGVRCPCKPRIDISGNIEVFLSQKWYEATEEQWREAISKLTDTDYSNWIPKGWENRKWLWR